MAEWPEEMRETAYQLWTFIHGRSCRAVAQAISAEQRVALPPRTVQHWAATERWEERAAAELAAIAPAIHQSIVADLILGAQEAARTLRRSVAEDDGSGAARPDKTQVQAALAILDRAGYSPLGRVAPVAPTAPATAATLPDVAALALADVDALERDHLERLRQRQAAALRDTRAR